MTATIWHVLQVWLEWRRKTCAWPGIVHQSYVPTKRVLEMRFALAHAMDEEKTASDRKTYHNGTEDQKPRRLSQVSENFNWLQTPKWHPRSIQKHTHPTKINSCKQNKFREWISISISATNLKYESIQWCMSVIYPSGIVAMPCHVSRGHVACYYTCESRILRQASG